MTSETSPGLVRSSELTRVRLAPNPGPMSLGGTNSYLIGAPGAAGRVVVDPGPVDEPHLQALAGGGPVELILITHRHADHTAAAGRLSELTGAPVRAADPAHCHGGPPLIDGETILAAGTEIRVLATPGHTSDSLCFHLPQDGPHGSVLTGDTILGTGTTVLDYPDGTLGDYLESLDRLERLGPAAVLPAHGPVLPALDAVVRAYREHRQGRLDQVRAALAALGADAGSDAGSDAGAALGSDAGADAGSDAGSDAGVAAVTDAVYADVDPSVRRAAELSVAAQLDYLRTHPTDSH